VHQPVTDDSRPAAARVYDYLLGGKAALGADRDLAERLLAEAGGGASVRELARINRSFVLTAAEWVARNRDITQFLDLGSGLPLAPNVHDAARQVRPGARVVYVDRDPMVLPYLAALAGHGLAAVKADAAEPKRVLEVAADLEEPGGGKLIDLSQPLCCIFGATLSAMDAPLARSAVAGYTEALVPGSCVVISCASYADAETGERMAQVYGAAGDWHNHGYEDVESFFIAAGKLRVVHGKPMNARCWPACPTVREQPAAMVLGGIGVLG
jgi:hypothetical protein